MTTLAGLGRRFRRHGRLPLGLLAPTGWLSTMRRRSPLPATAARTAPARLPDSSRRRRGTRPGDDFLVRRFPILPLELGTERDVAGACSGVLQRRAAGSWGIMDAHDVARVRRRQDAPADEPPRRGHPRTRCGGRFCSPDTAWRGRRIPLAGGGRLWITSVSDPRPSFVSGGDVLLARRRAPGATTRRTCGSRSVGRGRDRRLRPAGRREPARALVEGLEV